MAMRPEGGRSKREIQAEIKALSLIKPKIPEKSIFGDDNHAAINAQCNVLETRMRESVVYDIYDTADNPDPRLRIAPYILDCALEAMRWMNGETPADEPPSKDWGGLAK